MASNRLSVRTYAASCDDMAYESGQPRNRLLKHLWLNLPATSRGIILMVVSTVFASLMHTAVRYLSAELHPLQLVFFRNLFGLIVFLPLILRSGFSFLKTEKLPLHLLRAAVNVGAMMAFFMALSLAPLARVNGLAFTAPLFAAVMSVILLGERFRLRRWSAIVLGFVGALVILRPGFVPIDLGSWMTLIYGALFGLTMIIIRVLGRTESSFTTTAYMTILLSVLSLGPAIYVWQTPHTSSWIILLIIGLTGTGAQIALAEALKTAETSAVMPFDFLKIVWAAMLGFLLFAEVPTIYTWTGAAIIFASSFYVAYREQRLSKPTNVRAVETP